jgi:hypothetical protein
VLSRSQLTFAGFGLATYQRRTGTDRLLQGASQVGLKGRWTSSPSSGCAPIFSILFGALANPFLARGPWGRWGRLRTRTRHLHGCHRTACRWTIPGACHGTRIDGSCLGYSLIRQRLNYLPWLLAVFSSRQAERFRSFGFSLSIASFLAERLLTELGVLPKLKDILAGASLSELCYGCSRHCCRSQSGH